MAKAASVSVSKLSGVVQEAVKAAVAKHPRVRVDVDSPLAISYLIWGIPVPEQLADTLTVKETQAFAADVAKGLGRALPGSGLPSVFSHGGHLIIGIPAPPEVLFER
jgi:hypothetical protein